MENFKYVDEVVDGKKISEWLKSDEGLVDYSKCEFGRNVSNSEDYIIYDLGEYEHDPCVMETHYHNGVDLARVADCIKYYESYYGMSDLTALDGDVYISETDYHVFVNGRLSNTEEEWHAAVDELYSGEV